MSFEILLLALVLAALFISFVYCAITGISPVSSTGKSRRAIIKAIPADITGTVYELGAGWGALAFPLARRFRRARVIAIELSPVPYLFMRLFKLVTGPANLEIRRCNFMKVSLADAGVVVCYLHPQAMVRLGPKLAAELDRQATVICNTFELPDRQPTIIQKLEDLMCPEIFIYRPVPVRVRRKNSATAAQRY